MIDFQWNSQWWLGKCRVNQWLQDQHAGTYMWQLLRDIGDGDARTKSQASLGLTKAPFWAEFGVMKSLCWVLGLFWLAQTWAQTGLTWFDHKGFHFYIQALNAFEIIDSGVLPKTSRKITVRERSISVNKTNHYFRRGTDVKSCMSYYYSHCLHLLNIISKSLLISHVAHLYQLYPTITITQCTQPCTISHSPLKYCNIHTHAKSKSIPSPILTVFYM